MSYIKVLQKIFPLEYIDELVLGLLKEYANQSVSNATMLLNEIPNITKTILNKKNFQLQKKEQALYWMICHYETEKKNWNIGMLVPICMENYPNGCIDSHCEAEKRFFSKFLEFLKDKKNFDWEEDKKWAEQFGYWDWLCKVRENNF